jgi:ribosome biogenesis GTPase
LSTLEQYGFTDRIGGLFSFHLPYAGAAEPARVIRADRGRVLVAAQRGIVHLEGGTSLVTGDWAAIGHGGTVIGHLPRFSLVQRKRAYDPLSEAQVLGANIDVLGVVIPLDRPLSTNRPERTLVAARDSGAVPVIILTKADLSTGFDDVVAETVQQARGVEVFTTSAEQRDGLEDLRWRIGAGQTMALLGPSGAGKSSLINALVDDPRQDTGEVRAGDGRGRHTTTARELVPLGDGAVVMDTPGLRGFALWDAEDGLSQVFADVEAIFGEVLTSGGPRRRDGEGLPEQVHGGVSGSAARRPGNQQPAYFTPLRLVWRWWSPLSDSNRRPPLYKSGALAN